MQSTGRENEVLLDENLVQSKHQCIRDMSYPFDHSISFSILGAHLQPFYVREHSKRIIRGAIWNDSNFLANLNIMDYSLLVALDSEKHELVVGIVGS